MRRLFTEGWVELRGRTSKGHVVEEPGSWDCGKLLPCHLRQGSHLRLAGREQGTCVCMCLSCALGLQQAPPIDRTQRSQVRRFPRGTEKGRSGPGRTDRDHRK